MDSANNPWGLLAGTIENFLDQLADVCCSDRLTDFCTGHTGKSLGGFIPGFPWIIC